VRWLWGFVSGAMLDASEKIQVPRRMPRANCLVTGLPVIIIGAINVSLPCTTRIDHGRPCAGLLVMNRDDFGLVAQLVRAHA